MGRLIFADEIEKKVEEMYLDYRSRSQVPQPDGMILVDEKLTYAATVAKAILDMVKNTKTAYDTERVVEQLNDLLTFKVSATSEKHPFSAYEGEMISKHKVMGIVKKGGAE